MYRPRLTLSLSLRVVAKKVKFFLATLIFCVACGGNKSVVQNEPTSPKAVETAPLKVEFLKDPTLKKLVNVSGGILPSPLSIPLWGDLDSIAKEMERSDGSSLHNFGHEVFRFDKDRIYIHQSDMYLGHSECRFYNVKTKSFEKVSSCLSSSTGGSFNVQSLGDSLFFIFGYQEGPGEGNVIRWKGTSETDVLLAHVTNPTKFKTEDNSFVFESQCHPKKGTVPEITWSEKDCQIESNHCGYCAMTYGKLFSWKWNPVTQEIQFLGESKTSK